MTLYPFQPLAWSGPLTPLARRLLVYLTAQGCPLTAGMIRRRLSVDPRPVADALAELQAKGRVEAVGARYRALPPDTGRAA